MDKSNEILRFFGNRVRELRLSRKLSQEQFAFSCNLDRTYISDIERGKRNVSLINLKVIADALEIPIAKLLTGFPKNNALINLKEQKIYQIRNHLQINCGFKVIPDDVAHAAITTSIQLDELPFSLFQNIDLKALSGIVGALFVSNLALQVNALVNPIEKGHPDIIPAIGKDSSEEELRNYPNGLEIKCTVGNVKTGSNLQTGDTRISKLTGLTWQAHHREVKSLLGIVVDFAGRQENKNVYPIITAAFYSDNLKLEDWGKISGTTGRNTKVTSLLSSGKKKMGNGWLILYNDPTYQLQYQKKLSFNLSE